MSLSIATGCLLFSCGAPTVAPSEPDFDAAQPSVTTDSSEESVAPVSESPPVVADDDIPAVDELPVVDSPLTARDVESSAPPTAAELAVTERLEVAGINNSQAVKDFLAQMRGGAVSGESPEERLRQRTTLVNLVHYPLTTYSGGEPVKTYETPAELMADFDQVITPAVIEAMANAQYADLFLNYQGAMIGNGEVWFAQFDNGIKISAINSL